MKLPLVVSLVVSAIGIGAPIFAQQKDTVDLGTAQQRDIHGDAKALVEFGEFTQKRDEAFNKNDAAALAALFTEDAVLVAPDGMFCGRQAIEKRYADTFQRSPSTIFSDQGRILSAIDNAVWSDRKMVEYSSRRDWFEFVGATGQRFMFVRVTLGRFAC